MKWNLICALLLSATAWASGPPAEGAGEAALVAEKGRTPHSAIPALEKEARAAIDALEAQAATAPSSEDLQRQISELKQQYELRRLDVLAAECRQDGRESEALQAEARLADLRNPAATSGVRPRILSPEEKAAQEALRQNETTRPRPAAAGTPSSTDGGAQ
jgi:TolA-binding protein